MRNPTAAALISTALTVAAFGAPVIPDERVATYWQTVPYFDTASGDLAPEQYAPAPQGGFFIYLHDLSGLDRDFLTTRTDNRTLMERKSEVAYLGERCQEVYVSGLRWKRVITPCEKGTPAHRAWIQGKAPEHTFRSSLLETITRPAPAEAACAFDAATTYDHASASSHSFAHETAGSDRGLVLNAEVQGPTITSLTYDGVAMTKVPDHDLLTNRMTQWYLPDPAEGSNTVALTYSSADVGGGMAISLTGVDQSDMLGAENEQDSGSGVTSISTSITTDAANSWNVDFLRYSSGVSSSIAPTGANQTDRAVFQGPNTNTDYAASTQTTTAAGSYAMSWSWSGSERVLHGVIEIHCIADAPAYATPPGTVINFTSEI